jgi:DNA-binding transcriptional ArsR family regulator
MAARPVARRTADPGTDPTAAPARRPPVRDFTGGGGFAIEWDVRPAYDFLFSLSSDAGTTDDLPAPDRRWLTDARASLTQSAGTAIERLVELDVFVHLATYLIDRPGLRSAAEVVEDMAGTGQAEVLRAVFTETAIEADIADLIGRAVTGDAAVLPELEQRMPEWHRQERMVLLREPARAFEDIVAVLRGWVELFSTIEARIGGLLERDHALRAGDRGAFTGSDLVERTTGGVRYLAEPGVRRVVLAPSYFSRPYNFLLAGEDWRLFGYPIADAALDPLDPLSPPQAVVRLHRALGDETRLRILKLLAGRDLYLTEIAQQLELSKPTIKHHLAQLRAAGLVTVTDAGTVTYYSLRRPRLDDAAVELKQFLG